MTEEERVVAKAFIDEQNIRMVSERRALEKAGGKWDQPATNEELCRAEDRLIQILMNHKQWIKQVEARLEKMQTELAHTSGHAMHFVGNWQRAMGYSAGAVVSHADASWTAIVDIKSGSKEPGQQGAHWARLS
jgi:tetrahydromethanopterin S-methyltransferase subunit G